MFFFQLPWLPERTLSRDNYAYLAKALEVTSRRGTFTDEDLRVYREAWAQPGALTAMLNWYRAGLRARPSRPPSPRVRSRPSSSGERRTASWARRWPSPASTCATKAASPASRRPPTGSSTRSPSGSTR